MSEPPPSPRRADLLSRLGFAVAVAGIAVLALGHALFCTAPAGIVVQALAVLLMVWARLTFGRRSFHVGATPTAGGLVTTGPYRFVRHPIYAAILLFVWMGIAANLSPVSVALGLVVTAMLWLRISFEEPLVRQRYPEYAEYARRTKRVVPFIF